MSWAWVHVYVTPKKGVLDPQGKAVQSGLNHIGFSEIEEVHLGKFIEFRMRNPDKEKIEMMCKQLLANTVIEDYRYEIIKQK